MNEQDPIEDGEFVFRRIHRSLFAAGAAIPVWHSAFRPNGNDSTGLSVFREGFATPASILANVDPAKANDYYIARLPVAALRKLGLTVEPDPVAGGPLGHAVIPELAWPAYQAGKLQLKATLVELAKLASADIVHTPH
ncbi:MAG: hypothetical protein HYX68_10860 [Planctomycetes bacterium]|nr:hypothetical protein [Planctomycetota bacterium]